MTCPTCEILRQEIFRLKQLNDELEDLAIANVLELADIQAVEALHV